MKTRHFFHKAKVVAGFALLGAVVVGAFVNGFTEIDLRPYGAAAGAISAIALKLYHVS